MANYNANGHVVCCQNVRRESQEGMVQYYVFGDSRWRRGAWKAANLDEVSDWFGSSPQVLDGGGIMEGGAGR